MATATRKNTAARTQKRDKRTASRAVTPGSPTAEKIACCSRSPGRGLHIHRATAGNAIRKVSSARLA
jgi:hypothetical protein